MWFYIILFLFCVLMLLVNDKLMFHEKKYIEILTIIIFIIISGTRYHLGGSDYNVYKSVFDSLPTMKEFFQNYSFIHNRYLTYGFEIGYLFVNSLIKSVGFNFYGFTLFHSMFFYTALYKGLRRYIYNYNFLIIVFLYKLFFYNTFISMRQSITLAIFFLSLKYIEEKKPLKYFGSIIVASLFHSAALILIPVYFIRLVKLTKKKIILLNIVFIPTLIFSFVNFNILQYFDFLIGIFRNPKTIFKIENILFGGLDSSISVFHTLEYFLVMVLVIYNYNRIIKLNKRYDLIIKLFLILLPLFTLLRNYEILTRLKDYFTITYAFILSYISLINIRNNKAIVFISTILISGYGFYRFIILFDNGALIPYESYIFKGISIFSGNP